LVLFALLSIPLFTAMLLVIIILYPILLLYSLILIVFAPIFWIVDWVYWLRKMNNLLEVITIQEFHQVIVHFRNNRFRNRFVKTIREQGILVVNNETDIYITQLALAVEHSLMTRHKRLEKMIADREKNVWGSVFFGFKNLRESLMQLQNALLSFLPSPETIDITSSDYFETWVTDYEKKIKGRLARWGPDFLDEIWKLSEQIRANRRDK